MTKPNRAGRDLNVQVDGNVHGDVNVAGGIIITHIVNYLRFDAPRWLQIAVVALLAAQVRTIQPEGTGSLACAIQIAVARLVEAQPPGIVRRLFVIAGGGDPCEADEWAVILNLLDLSLRDIDVRTWLIVMADEAVDEQVAARLQEEITRLGIASADVVASMNRLTPGCIQTTCSAHSARVEERGTW